MGEANKIISLLIGLFFVIVVVSLIAGRISVKDSFLSLNKATPTPTQTANESIKMAIEKTSGQSGIQRNIPVSGVTPATGLPTAFLSLTSLGLIAGIIIRKKS